MKNQKKCSSCSAFAATAVHETCMILAGAPKDNIDLSEQQLIDCAYDNRTALGCDGAFIGAYSTWLVGKNGGRVNHESNYEYLANQPNLECQNIPFWRAGATVNRAIIDHDCDEAKLKILVAKYKSVVSVMYSGDKAFTNYKGGIYDACT